MATGTLQVRVTLDGDDVLAKGRMLGHFFNAESAIDRLIALRCFEALCHGRRMVDQAREDLGITDQREELKLVARLDDERLADGHAVWHPDGYFTGIWRQLETAQKILGRSPMAKGERIRPMRFLDQV